MMGDMAPGDLVAKIQELEERCTVFKAERDENKHHLDRLAAAFESAMEMAAKKIQLAYVSGWTAGRVMDERVQLSQNITEDAKMFMEALASYRRWEEEQRKRSPNG